MSFSKQKAPILEVKNLSISYGGIQAIRNINFSILNGEKISLIGANGAGKSTAIKLLIGELKPSKGVIPKTRHKTVSICNGIYMRYLFVVGCLFKYIYTYINDALGNAMN